MNADERDNPNFGDDAIPDELGDDLGGVLRTHLSRELDPQLGRALAAFEAAAAADERAAADEPGEADEPAAAEARADAPRGRSRLVLWLTSTGAVAAGVAIAWALTRPAPVPVPGPHVPLAIKPIGPSPATRGGGTDATIPLIDLQPGDVERMVAWKAIDEGPRVIDTSQPVRRVRLESVEQIRWTDPDTELTFQLAVPQEQVLLLRQQSF